LGQTFATAEDASQASTEGEEDALMAETIERLGRLQLQF
jgi:hypothetical protein